MTLGRKDLRLAQEAAAADGVELASAPADPFELASAPADPSLAELDWASIAEITRKRSQ